MKSFRGITVGSSVEFYRVVRKEKVEGSEHVASHYPHYLNGGGLVAYTLRNVYSDTPTASGVVVKIKGHNGSACRIYLDNGQEVEANLDTFFKIV